MKHVRDLLREGSVIPFTVIIGAFSLMLLTGVAATVINAAPQVYMQTEPRSGLIQTGDTFTVRVVVSSTIAVNVFAGELDFDNNVLSVQSIDYNTSIANLWAEKPWYSNGAGTLNFAGGTTQPGGFTGKDTLLTVHFKALRSGSGNIALRDTHILQHDGLGTNALLQDPIDSIFTVQDPQQEQNMIDASNVPTRYTIADTLPSSDFNGDGVRDAVDVSIFMVDLAKGDTRADLNGDGRVNLRDLSVLLNAK